MSKGKTQTPWDFAKEKGLRLGQMLTEVVDGVKVLEEQKQALAAQVADLIASAAPDALKDAGRLTEQVETVTVDIARKSAMVEGIEENIRASASAVAVLERERDREILEVEGRELNEARRILFEKFRALIAGCAADVKAIEAPHQRHQALREKVFGSPEGRARRELDQLRAIVARLMQEMRGMP